MAEQTFLDDQGLKYKALHKRLTFMKENQLYAAMTAWMATQDPFAVSTMAVMCGYLVPPVWNKTCTLKVTKAKSTLIFSCIK